MANTKKGSNIELTYGVVTLAYVIIFGYTLGVFVVTWLVSRLWNGELLFTLPDLWIRSEDPLAGVTSVWWLYVWGAGITLIGGIILILARAPREFSPGEILGKGLWISLHAGIVEELAYRWLRFSIALLALPALNWILFGFIPGQMGLLHWLYQTFLLPIADFVTLGALQDYLFYPGSWVVGAAIISANGKFREAHEQNGFFNQVNAWFGGMVLFYVMFEYGLFTAIIVHVLYDVVVFGTSALMNIWRPSYSSMRSVRDLLRA